MKLNSDEEELVLDSTLINEKVGGIDNWNSKQCNNSWFGDFRSHDGDFRSHDGERNQHSRKDW